MNNYSTSFFSIFLSLSIWQKCHLGKCFAWTFHLSVFFNIKKFVTKKFVNVIRKINFSLSLPHSLTQRPTLFKFRSFSISSYCLCEEKLSRKGKRKERWNNRKLKNSLSFFPFSTLRIYIFLLSILFLLLEFYLQKKN